MAEMSFKDFFPDDVDPDTLVDVIHAYEDETQFSLKACPILRATGGVLGFATQLRDGSVVFISTSGATLGVEEPPEERS